MKFKYQARNKEGELQVGFVESYSKEGATSILLSHDLFVLSIESAEKPTILEMGAKLFQRVSLNDLMIFTRQFATLLASKVPLSDSLKNLYKQTRKANLKQVINDISHDVDSGLSLSAALEKQYPTFSEFYISMVRSAEVTGHMEEAMDYLATHLEKQKIWRSRVINSLMYPGIIFFLFAGVLVLLNTMVLPNLKPVFENSGMKLPWFTTIIFNTGEILSSWWWVILIITIPIVAYAVDYFKSKEGQIVFDEIILRTPVFGNLFSKMYVVRFAESLSVLIKGDIPIAQAIEITANSVGSYVYRDALYDISSRVRGGELLSDSINAYSVLFPPIVGQMVGIGETTGRLEELLTRVGILFEKEVDDIMNRLGELIQPFVMILIGAFVGLLFAGILIPLYDLMQSFRL